MRPGRAPRVKGPSTFGLLAPTMVTAVGGCLCALGLLGATLAAWQLVAWLVTGGPVVAEVWARYGLTGELFGAFIRWLPLWLVLGGAFHAWFAWLGFGLFWRRPWARRHGVAFAFVWAAVALVFWAVAWFALDDLQQGYPDRAAFAVAVKPLAAQVALINVALAAALLLLLIQPSVKAQFAR
jgi:hypothetical protein